MRNTFVCTSMNEETTLDDLRREVGLEVTLARIVSRSELSRSLRPVVEATLMQPEEPLRVPQAAELSGLAPMEFSKQFREASGLPFHEFVDRVRVDAALLRIFTTLTPVDAIAHELGFMGVETLGLSIGEYTGLPFAAILSLLRP